MKFASGWVLAILAAFINLGITTGLILLQKESLVSQAIQNAGGDPKSPHATAKTRFWGFNATDVDAYVTELKSERAKLVERQGELDKVAAHIDSEKQELEKTRQDLVTMREEISAQLPEVQDSEKKNLKVLAQTYGAMTPQSVVSVFRQMDETTCVKLLSLMKPDKVSAIFQEMCTEDKDGSLAKAAAHLSDKLRLVKSPTPPPQS